MSAPSQTLPIPKPSILLIASSYAPNIGGLQNVTGNLAHELRRRGYKITVVTQRFPRSLPAADTSDGVPVARFLFLTPRLADLQRGRVDLFLASFFYFPLTLFMLLRELARQTPDLVNLHFAGAPTLFVLITHWLFHFRLMVSLHGDDIQGIPRRSKFERRVLQLILRRAEMVTACSRALLDEAAAVEPSIMNKARVIYNGIELPPAQPITQSNSIFAVGRIVPKKGFDILLRAVAQTPASRLTLIGEGPELSRLQTLAQELGLNGRAELQGAKPRSEIWKGMAASCAVVIPSRREPFGLVALEAMAMGRPIIAARVGGLPEVLEGADALLIEPENPTELADAIRSVMTRVEQEPSYGLRNRAIAAKFSISRMVDQYATLYDGHFSSNAKQ